MYLNLCSVFRVVGYGLVSSSCLVDPEGLQLLLVLCQLVGQDVDVVPHLRMREGEGGREGDRRRGRRQVEEQTAHE